MKKRLLASVLVAACIVGLVGQSYVTQAGNTKAQDEAGTLQTKILAKSESGNPMLGFDEKGKILYGGDPSILVDGDTVYCYVGHDTSTNESYYMPDWRCYSSKDMVNWTYESMIMSGKDIPWAADDHQCWAAQVMKGKDGKYYFYYCTETNSTYKGGKSIGVAVSDSPTGPFEDIGEPLIRNADTGSITGSPIKSTWEDIDPTAWMETDENGEDHVYLGWGNSRFFNCELISDVNDPDYMIAVKDRDGDGKASIGNYSFGFGDQFDIAAGVINGMPEGKPETGDESEHHFTEAPYYYRQQDENGNYFGPYYMFFAMDWREQMAYATTDDIASNEWEFGGILMEPSATANTNHMAVFDFKGQTYFVYHDGSLPHGSGFRRVACVEPIEINEDGTIDPIKKTAVGLKGTMSTISNMNGEYISHVPFVNELSDSKYPKTGYALKSVESATEEAEWEILKSKALPTRGEFVSIESNNKPGMYLTVTEPVNGVITPVLSQDVNGTEEEAESMTFKTYEGLSGAKGSVSFESMQYPGYFLTITNGKVKLVQEPNAKEATFKASGAMELKTSVQKTKTLYAVGDTLNVDDIRVYLHREDGKNIKITEVKTNASTIDMSKTGAKKLAVTYTYNGKKCTDEIVITVVDKAYFGK